VGGSRQPAGSLLTGIIDFIYLKAAGFFKGVEIDWGGMVVVTIVLVGVLGTAGVWAIRMIGAPQRKPDPLPPDDS
jgi:hypothetical protein